MLNHYITGELSIQKMSLCACGEIFQQVILKILVKNFSLLAVAEVFGRTSQVVRKTSYKNCVVLTRKESLMLVVENMLYVVRKRTRTSTAEFYQTSRQATVILGLWGLWKGYIRRYFVSYLKVQIGQLVSLPVAYLSKYGGASILRFQNRHPPPRLPRLTPRRGN